MAGIRITPFSGLSPSSNPKLLEDSAATVAQNLNMRWGDFRPRNSDTTVATIGTSNPQTIYRLSRSVGGAFNTNPATGWVVKSADVSFVKAQINDDQEERTYFTGDGRPKATDTSLTERPLGVPVPGTIAAPAVTVVDEYTVQERTGDIEHMIDTIEWAIKTGLPSSPQWFGATNAAALSLTQRTTANGFSPEHPIHVVKGIAGNGTTLTDSANYGFLLDPKLDGFWNGTFYCIPICAYGYAGEVSTTMETNLNNILDPKTLSSAFLTSAQKTSIRDMVDDMFDLNDDFLKSKSNELSTTLKAFDVAVSNGLGVAKNDAVSDFYASSAVSSALTAAKNAFANEVYTLANRIMSYDHVGA